MRGVIRSIFSLALLLVLYSFLENKKIKTLAQFAIITFSASLLLIFVGIFDKEGVIQKYYLYRINTLSVFTSLLVYVHLFFRIIKPEHLGLAGIAIMVLSGLFPLQEFAKGQKQIQSYLSKKDYNQFCKRVKATTEKDAVLMYLDTDPYHDRFYNLMRKTQRPRYVLNKFIPSDISKMPDWHARVVMRENVRVDISKLEQAKQNHRIDYVVSEKDYPSLNMVFSVGTYKLYDVRR